MEPEMLAGFVAERVRAAKAEGKTQSGKAPPAANGLQHLPTDDYSDSHSNHRQRSTPDLRPTRMVELSGNALPPAGLPEPATAKLTPGIFEPRRSRIRSSDALVPPITDLLKLECLCLTILTRFPAALSAARGPLRCEICDFKQNEYACLRARWRCRSIATCRGGHTLDLCMVV